MQRLGLDANKIVTKVAREVAKQQKKQARRGIGGDGKRMPEAKDTKKRKPMNRTGTLIKSIKARKTRRGFTVVEPSGKRQRGFETVDNFKIAAVNAFTRGVKLMGLSSADRTRFTEQIRKEMVRQIERSPRGGVVWKLKRLTRQGR